MEVNFRSLRKDMVFAMNDLIEQLNSNMEDGIITIDASQIKPQIECLSIEIATLACVIEDDGSQTLYDELCPKGDKLMKMLKEKEEDGVCL